MHLREESSNSAKVDILQFSNNQNMTKSTTIHNILSTKQT